MRLVLVGLAHVVLLPFLLLFMVVYFFLQNAQEWHSSKVRLMFLFFVVVGIFVHALLNFLLVLIRVSPLVCVRRTEAKNGEVERTTRAGGMGQMLIASGGPVGGWVIEQARHARGLAG